MLYKEMAAVGDSELLYTYLQSIVDVSTITCLFSIGAYFYSLALFSPLLRYLSLRRARSSCLFINARIERILLKKSFYRCRATSPTAACLLFVLISKFVYILSLINIFTASRMPRTPSRIINLKQSVTITGLSSKPFESSV